MSKPRQKRKQQPHRRGYNPASLIETVTDSVDRIGIDNAVPVAVIVLSFVSLLVNVHAISVIAVAFSVTFCYLCVAGLNQRWRVQRLEFELQLVREKRGKEFIEHANKEPDQLSLLNGDD
jgi:membrane protein YdbS with pleckstrin-like domain